METCGHGLHLSALVVAAFLAGCAGGDDGGPIRLVDGSRALELPIELQGVGRPAVLTASHVTDVLAVQPGSKAETCLRKWGTELTPAGPLVERVGVSAESITFGEQAGFWVLGCNDSPGPREGDRPWCGGAIGQLYGGRLRDPRIDIGCLSKDGKTVGFAWIEPARGARYVVVEQHGYVEVYEVAGGLPIRVATTSGVRIEGSRAVFDLSEHDAEGSLSRRYRLEAGVAG
jgi:hypothetical protein